MEEKVLLSTPYVQTPQTLSPTNRLESVENIFSPRYKESSSKRTLREIVDETSVEYTAIVVKE